MSSPPPAGIQLPRPTVFLYEPVFGQGHGGSMKYFPSFLIQAFIQAFRQAFIQSFIQGTLVMKIFRRRKVQLEKRPKSGYFFVFRLKNRRAEELRSENGCFGTENVDFPIGFGGPEARKRPKT